MPTAKAVGIIIFKARLFKINANKLTSVKEKDRVFADSYEYAVLIY